MYQRSMGNKMFLQYILSGILCAGLAGCGSPSQVTQVLETESPERGAAPTLTSLPEETQPTITPTTDQETTPPTSTPDYAVLTNLRRQLLFAGGGGGGSDDTGLRCEEPSLPPYSEIPTLQGTCRFRDCLMEEDYTCNEDIYHLYLFGFPFGQEIRIELYDPTGKPAGNAVLIVEEFSAENNYGHVRQIEPRVPYNVSSTYATTIGEVEVLDIGLWLPGWQPTGEWYVQAQSGNLSAEGSFSVQSQESFPNLYVIPGELPGPFEEYQEYNFTAGQQFSILGTGFQAGETYALGIYYLASQKGEPIAELVVGTAVKANEDGNFSAQVKIDGSDPAGDYLAFVDINPSYDHTVQAGVSAGYGVESWTPCSDGLLSYLGPKTSKSVQVNQNSTLPATLRAEPGVQAEMIGQLQPGDGVFIMEGPVCQDGMVWWFVENGDTEQQGWMPETDAVVYWLEPVW